MRILYIGGTGLISTACTTAAVAAGHDGWLLNRGKSRLPAAVGPDRVLTADAYDEQQVRAAIKGLDFDVVVQWVGYLPHQVEQDIQVFSGTGQYIFISTAATYEKPPSNWMHTESTPLTNPFWEYGQ